MKVSVINHPIRYVCNLPHTSTEHETLIFPTAMPDEDGSNRSSTSESDSESCDRISNICNNTKGKWTNRYSAIRHYIQHKKILSMGLQRVKLIYIAYFFYKETDILIDKKVCTRKDKRFYNQDGIGSLKKWLPTTRTKKTIKQVLNRAEAQEIKPFSLTL